MPSSKKSGRRASLAGVAALSAALSTGTATTDANADNNVVSLAVNNEVTHPGVMQVELGYMRQNLLSVLDFGGHVSWQRNFFKTSTLKNPLPIDVGTLGFDIALGKSVTIGPVWLGVNVRVGVMVPFVPTQTDPNINPHVAGTAKLNALLGFRVVGPFHVGVTVSEQFSTATLNNAKQLVPNSFSSGFNVGAVGGLLF